MSYISNLNLLNADLPVAIDEEALQQELALWANAKFNFDTTTPHSSSSVLPKSAEEKQHNNSNGADNSNESDLLETLTKLTELVQPNSHIIQQQQQFLQQAPSSLSFYNQHDYLLHTSDNALINATIPSAMSTIKSPAIHQLPRIAPAPGPVSGIQMLEAANVLKTANSSRTSNSSAANNNNNNNNKKRPRDNHDESEISAEDDKRRRNTAASARFRLKKKMREQALEKQSKEMAAHVEKLESKVKELEMEAKWLRALVVEKDPKLLTSTKEENSSV